jgi:hypothetical protein
MAPSLDGAADVAVVAIQMACGVTPRRKVTPLLLSRLGAPSLRPSEPLSEVSPLLPPHRWGVNVGVAPVGGGRHLGWPTERGTALGGRTLCLLLESDVEEPVRLIQLLVGLWVRRVGDVFQAAGDGRHVVRHIGEAEVARSARASVIVERVHGFLPRNVPSLALELYLGGLKVHLSSSQAVHLLLKVGHAVAGTLVQRCEPGRLL